MVHKMFEAPRFNRARERLPGHARTENYRICKRRARNEASAARRDVPRSPIERLLARRVRHLTVNQGMSMRRAFRTVASPLAHWVGTFRTS